jgi:subtilisin family serine protease
MGLEGVHLVTLPHGVTVEEAISAYHDDPVVVRAEPNYLVFPTGIPDDALFSSQWALRNTGQPVSGLAGTTGSDIHAVPAWDLTTGKDSVVIAIVDTGVDVTHPDLAENIWTNPGEVAGNGIDDDGNGLTDDVHGWDFINNDAVTEDACSHGTDCAGIIGAVGNNSVGVAGVMHRVQLMPIKYYNTKNEDSYTSTVIACILYARAKGARIVSCSFGSYDYSYWMEHAIRGTDALFVCAAGNSGSNNDVTPFYPASVTAANIIAVAATDNNDHLVNSWWSSNYGSRSVDLAAPGWGVLAATNGGGYRLFEGTSAAAPHVAGVAGLVMARAPDLSVPQVRARILEGVDPVDALSEQCMTGGRLNASRALARDSADFTCAPLSGKAPLLVRFTDLSLGEPTSWQWTFGDGGGSTDECPMHRFDIPGTYTITLAVTNAFGRAEVRKTGLVTVQPDPQGVRAIPGGAGLPTDTDGDGLFEDVNGNGRTDFADITLFFAQLGWIAANEPATAFDFNGNGRIDFADVVMLFHQL